MGTFFSPPGFVRFELTGLFAYETVYIIRFFSVSRFLIAYIPFNYFGSFFLISNPSDWHVLTHYIVCFCHPWVLR